MNKRRNKTAQYITIILILLISFIIVLTMCDYAIITIKNTKESAIINVKKRDFEAIWAYVESLKQVAEEQTDQIAINIEQEIRNNYDLEQLETELDNNNPVYEKEIHDIIRSNIDGVYLGDIKNNRNSMIVLEGYNTIMEDLFVDPDSRENKVSIDKPIITLSDYRETTYNVQLFDSAIRKIRTHTNHTIIIEPYNYLGDDHMKIKEGNYSTLEDVYLKEGITGLRNYQFLVPVYITDTGDIFGQKDIVNGKRQDNHKFIVIQTFNIYDQILNLKPEFGDDDYLGNMIRNYDNILMSLYILGIVVCAIIVLIVTYFASLYNLLIDRDQTIQSYDKSDLP